MNFTELRIGNLIYQGNYGEAPITAYELYQFSLYQVGAPTADYYKYWKPILLFEEWLLKFGFKEEVTKHSKFFLLPLKIVAGKTLKGLCFYWETSEGEWQICFTDYYTGIEKTEMFPYSIKHVHQLQNLYYALTSEELTISVLKKL